MCLCPLLVCLFCSVRLNTRIIEEPLLFKREVEFMNANSRKISRLLLYAIHKRVFPLDFWNPRSRPWIYFAVDSKIKTIENENVLHIRSEKYLKNVNLHKNPDENPEPVMDYWNRAKTRGKNVSDGKSWVIWLWIPPQCSVHSGSLPKNIMRSRLHWKLPKESIGTGLGRGMGGDAILRRRHAAFPSKIFQYSMIRIDDFYNVFRYWEYKSVLTTT